LLRGARQDASHIYVQGILPPPFFSINRMRLVPKLFILYVASIAAGIAASGDVCAQSEADAINAPLAAPPVITISAASQPGAELPVRLLPYTVQGIDSDSVRRSQGQETSEIMNRHLAGVTLSNAQGNPLQQEVQYRGFSATPQLGGSQGISVYLDGVLINELFGDTVNWDLLPKNGIANLSLLSGANPVFGLNTLGGAIDIHTKTGFDTVGSHAELGTGSFGRTTSNFETGGHDERWGYYIQASHLHERGWRDLSPSDVNNVLASSSWRWDSGSADLRLAHTESSLSGNGAAPVDELAVRRSAVFTAPDRTNNRLDGITLNASQDWGSQTRLAGTLYERQVRTLAYNGDQSSFKQCSDDASVLCEDDGTRVRDQHGKPAAASYDAIANLGVRAQHSHGATMQMTDKAPLLGLRNQLVLGADLARGSVDYHSQLALAHMTYPTDLPIGSFIADDTGLTVPEHALSVNVTDYRYGAYLSDTLELTPQWALTAAARYNSSRTMLQDNSGLHPELDGDHRYHRLNPALGATYQWSPSINLFAGYSEATRVPTPVELSCADPTAPCLLPNDFVADPELKQVVAKSWEAGVRGKLGDLDLHWQASLFRTKNVNDILFQATGGAQSNRGFYANVGDTRRQGLQLSLNGHTDGGRLDWFMNYTYLDATFQTPFDEVSANHPDADPVTGLIHVSRGNRIPGLPSNAFKAGIERRFDHGLSLGTDMIYNSGQYLRGDEANLMGKTAGYPVFNLHGRYQIDTHMALLLHLDNALNRRYATFGTLGDPTSVMPASSNPRFVSLGAPRSAAISLSVDL